MDVKVKQRDITDCGAACLASVGRYYKLDLSVADIRRRAGIDMKGTNIKGMIEAAASFGFEARGVKGSFEGLFNIPLPAIAHILVKKSLHHYVVLSRVTRHFIEIMDPADGDLHKKGHSEFKAEWTGVLVVLLPPPDLLPVAGKRNRLSRLWRFIQPHRKLLAQALAGASLYAILGLSTSVFIQKIVDHVIGGRSYPLLNLMGTGMILLLLLRSLSGVFKNVISSRIGQLIDAQLILGYYGHVMRLPQQFFDSMRVGEIISRIGDAVKIRLLFNDIVINFIVGVFMLVSVLALMFTYYWKLALSMFLVIPCYGMIYSAADRFHRRTQRKLMEDSAEFESQLVESLNNIGTLKRFGLEGHSNHKTGTRFAGFLRTAQRSALVSLFSGASMEFVSQLFTILLLWTGGGLVVSKQISVGELLSFYALTGYFTGPVLSIISSNKIVQDALIATDRWFEIMDLDCEKQGGNSIELNNPGLGSIRFRNVSFRYGTRTNVFSGLNLDIPLRSLTGIAGESGCGKSTLAALLQNIYPLAAGNIFIGEQSIDQISNRSLRAAIGIVPQVTHLFRGTLLSNIAIGEEEINMRNVWAICERLGLISLIEGLPRGLETIINENGNALSGGQRQRIAIARALYRDPEILILDEATSSMDPVSEQDVQDTLSHFLQRGKTVIIIAHRLSTIRRADKIIVLKNGRVEEEGTHAGLMALRSEYYRLWTMYMPMDN